MHTSCAMMALSVTPSAEDEGAEVNGAVEAEGVAVYVWGSLGLSCASLHQTVAVFMAPITKKMRRDGKGDGKMAKYPCDSRRKNDLITGRRIPIDIYKG